MQNPQLTKRERYLLKKQRKEQERFRKARKKKIKKIVGISIISLVAILITGGIIWINLSRSNQGVPEIAIILQEYDAGTVSMAAGLIEHTYGIKNIGIGVLKINRIWTSCMCTTARLRVGDKKSEEFGMHSKPIWSQKIAPGETGYLEITFDPAFHGPGGTGPVVRTVYLSTNDPDNRTAEVRLIANVKK